mgnify:CR=1 FL=1|tara:strand:+ start:356 stop:550 length:195 start_codon:yes stop_codon:yes gene_type:complete
MGNKKRYILTIEYDQNGDNCEYIEEKLISESSDEQVTVLGSIDLNDYFSESDLACVMEHNIGES